jgi:hypothetical protein
MQKDASAGFSVPQETQVVMSLAVEEPYRTAGTAGPVRSGRRANPYGHLVKRLLVALVAVGLVSTACGDDDAAVTTTTVPTTTRAPTTTAVSSTTAAPTTTLPPTTTTTTTAPAPPRTFEADLTFDFTLQDETTPALAPGDSWDISYSYSPNPVPGDGVIHMFYTGWGFSEVGAGYATSSDGRTFQRVTTEGPLFEYRINEGGSTFFAQRPLVRVRDDGVWEMYFSENVSKRFSGPRIMRATAPSPEGPWTVEDTPVFEAIDDGWDVEAVPHALVELDGRLLLFYGGPLDRTAAVGLLVSEDGVTFTPHDDPATPNPSDPVLGRTGMQSWDGAGVGSPVVFVTDEGALEMLYLGFEGPEVTASTHQRMGYARSTDGGVTWERYAGNPVIEVETQNSVPSSLGFPWLGGFKMGDAYYVYYALGAGGEGIGLMTGTIIGS